MKKLLLIFPVLLCLLAFVVPNAQAAAVYVNSSDQQGSAAVNEQTNDDAFVVGNLVNVTAPVGSELFAAGNVVSITKLGRRSNYVAGNTVTLSGTYGHDVYAAGNSIIVKEGTVINGDLRISGSVVDISGTIKGSVYASG